MPRKKSTIVKKGIAKKNIVNTNIKKRRQALQAVKGMRDILPVEMKMWDFIREVIDDTLTPFSYNRIETPILEKTELFERSTGEETDIVQKEMFSFKTKGGEYVTMRPEGTPGIVRAYVENGMSNLIQPVKLYYVGTMYRYEKPQAGRYRQFHQLNLEAIGNSHPVLDAEIIYLFHRILNKLGLGDIEVQINSIGCKECRKEYRSTLVDYFTPKKRQLCEDCKKRLKSNPFRILDCKKEKCINIASGVPPIVDYLCEECGIHFKRVLEYLDEAEIVYNLNTTLMRGLDYYTKTIFEIWPAGDKQSAQSALGGGGRYDNLVKMLGGKETTAVGGALGMERIIEKLKERGIEPKNKKSPDVLLIQLGELAKKKSLKIFENLIESGIYVREALHRDSIKSQLRYADKLGVKFSLILGQKEAQEDMILVRNMYDGVQELVRLDRIVDEIKKRIKSYSKK